MQEFFESSNDATEKLIELIKGSSKYSESGKMEIIIQVSDEMASLKIETQGPGKESIPTVRRILEILILSDKDGQDKIDFYIRRQNKEDKRKIDYFP